MKGAFKLDDAAPWGRNRAEYATFFDLGALPEDTRILDSAAGPSSFTAEMAALGYDVVAADPLYALNKAQIKLRIELTREAMMSGLRAAAERFVWDAYGTPEILEATRMATMKHFLEDYEPGRAEGRYVVAALPDLPFDDGAFDLALSSHFLFMYSERFDLDFHVAATFELCRLAREVRIFPLLDLEGARSRHVAPLLEACATRGLTAEIKTVDYEFQKGGDEMLRIEQGR